LQEFSDENRGEKESVTACGIHHGGNNPGTCDQYDIRKHEVSVSSFYIDPYETTQEEYERLMGNNPGTFTGEKLPAENISWLDAVYFANAKSIEAGLTPAYTVTSDGVTWDMSANGYRLPTEAEWENTGRLR